MLTKRFHQSRREAYAKLIPDRSIGILFSGEEQFMVADDYYPFEVNRDFYYLTGYDKPKAVYVGWRVNGTYRDTLFIEAPNAREILYNGHMATTEELVETLGIESIRYTVELEDFFSRLLFANEMTDLYVDELPWRMSLCRHAAYQFVEKLRAAYPQLAVHNTNYALGLIRSHKEPEEIDAHRQACLITEKGVKNMLTHIRPGMTEGQIEAYFDFTLKTENAGHAFTTIAAAGKNSCTLHYSDNNCVMQDGDLILFDLGASVGYYCADVSRTYPVNGKFTPRQRELYNVVLKGLDAALAATKPGQPKHLLQELSKQVMAEELIKLGMIEKPEEISRYYKHGSGHFIGLFTHDVGDDEAVLEKDMVFTLEPGLYFAEEHIGIRIEDTILITEDGCEVLSGGIPKTPEEIEAFMANKEGDHNG